MRKKDDRVVLVQQETEPIEATFNPLTGLIRLFFPNRNPKAEIESIDGVLEDGKTLYVLDVDKETRAPQVLEIISPNLVNGNNIN